MPAPEGVPEEAPAAAAPAPSDDLALVLTGGGARAAYQVGVLAGIAKHFPELRTPILTGVSAGAVNVAHLAAHSGNFADATRELVDLWCSLTVDRVFEVDTASLAKNAVRWGAQLFSGGVRGAPIGESLVDTSPLRAHLSASLGTPPTAPLPGIAENLRRGDLRAAAIITTSYSTGETVVWVEGREVDGWTRSRRRGVQARLTIEHVMASTALPLFFPSIQLGDAWFGDGGIRLAAPLSPALHLGASRILAVSTRYEPSAVEASSPTISGYPPPAQVLGILMNAVFLDLIDQDALRLDRLNRLLAELPPERRNGMRIVDLLVIRPSFDLGRLARQFEPKLPRAFRFMTRGLGTRETGSPDILAMLMFQPDYIEHLIEIGRGDAESRVDEIGGFLAG
jgi:NTE family protein